MTEVPVGLVAIHIFLVWVVFLVIANGFLHGRLKRRTDAVLSILWVGTLTAISVLYGWKSGAAAVGLSFVYAIVVRPLARGFSGWLLSHPPR